MRIILNIVLLVAATLVMNSCTKQETNPLLDARPDVPVSITNATEFRPDPTVTSSLGAGGNIQITLAVPEGSSRTIKEITRVVSGADFSLIQTTSTTGLFVGTPIAVNAKTYTFNTTIAQYFVVREVNATSNPAAKANNELAYRFYFLVTLDDGTQVISMPVRVLVLT